MRIPAAQRLVPGEKNERFSPESFPTREFSVSEDTSGTCFLGDLAKPEIELVDPISQLTLVLNWEDAPHHRYVALWSRTTDSPFYCIEPWTAMPNSFSRRAPGELILLAPGQTFRAGMWMGLRE
jgi:galactose mutarotase-like enzyme